MKNMKKHIFSLVFALCVIFSLIPATAFADEVEATTTETAKVTTLTERAEDTEPTKPTEQITPAEQTEAAEQPTAYSIPTEALAKMAKVKEKAEPEVITPDMLTYADENGFPVLTSGESYNFKYEGTFRANGWRWTWYTSRQLYHKNTKQWFLCDDGFYRTSDGYIVVASQHHEKGTIIDTPFGKGIVLDWCGTEGTIDIYTRY